MKETALKALEGAIKRLGIEPPQIEIEQPKEEAHGDLSSPISMVLAKSLRRKPSEIARAIVESIPLGEDFEKIEVAGPGFINFTFSKSFISKSLSMLLKDRERALRKDIGRGRKVQIEFVSANPTGPLHLGHGRGAAVGEALANLLNAAGWSVIREYYINDAGRQVRLLGESVYARYKELLGVSAKFPEEGYMGQYVIDIAKSMIDEVGQRYKDSDFQEVEGFFIDFSLRAMLNEIRADLQAFGIEFDSWQSEKDLYISGAVRDAIEYLKAKGYAYEHEGAVWFKATLFGDDKDRVIIKKDGEHTYFASDIAYHKKKIDTGYDEIIDIWGADHHGYIPRITAVIDALGYEKNKLKVLLVQMVSLLRGGKAVQMSKRAGEFVTLREVIEEVGADTTKFIFLTRRPESHLEFDIESAKMQSSENPVYYVQYANARINSIFSNVEGLKIEEADFTLLVEAEEKRLAKKILSYPMVFESSAIAHEPHRITFYLQELASLFHRFYTEHKVLVEDTELRRARLALCEAVRIVLRDGLKILGVSIPERM